MFIGIVHYHLNRGGVTQVIANQLRALETQRPGGDLRIVILHGGRSDGWSERLPEVPSLDYSTQAVEGLDYEDQPRDPRALAAALSAALRRAGGSPDAAVIHVHNHSLGKNPTLPAALCRLARDGWPLLLQIHDFAEDFRPEDYARVSAGVESALTGGAVANVYPAAAHVHYAVLNRRDARILSAAGVASGQLHALPNAVGDIGPLPPREPARRELACRFRIPEDRCLLVYPVRGIRRKNLGESLLWSALAEDLWHLGLTLAPASPAERPSYERWKTLAASLRLPMAFEIGEHAGLSHGENLAAADRMLTTSVAEGFGLVFLESWLAGKALVGRDLPEITADFMAAGLRLDGLRPQFEVPLDWIGAARWRHEFEQAYTQTLARVGRRLPAAGEFRRTLDSLVHDVFVDFAVLSSDQQRQVVGQVAESRARRRRLRSRNTWLDIAFDPDAEGSDAIVHNAEVVRSAYSLAACGRRLFELYRDVASSSRGGDVQPLVGSERILDEFLRPERFHPLRVEP